MWVGRTLSIGLRCKLYLLKYRNWFAGRVGVVGHLFVGRRVVKFTGQPLHQLRGEAKPTFEVSGAWPPVSGIDPIAVCPSGHTALDALSCSGSLGRALGGHCRAQPLVHW